MSKKLIGGHIRPTQMPGAMMGVAGPARPKNRTNWKGVVHQAASDYLAKRGFHNQINGFEAAAYNPSARFKAIVSKLDRSF